MKVVTAFLIVIAATVSKAQYIEPLDSLLSQIISNNKNSLDDDITLLNTFKEKNWLSVLPSIGYDLITNRPMVSFSFNNYITLNQRKRDLQYRIAQVKIKYSEQLTADTISCIAYYNTFTQTLNHYAGQIDLLHQSQQLLEIKIEENKNLQATSEDVLKVKLALDQSALSVNQMKNEIVAKALQLSLLIKRQLRYQLP